MTKRNGPLRVIQTTTTCDGCNFLRSVFYRTQGDSGFDYFCDMMDGASIPDMDARTPAWCPLIDAAVTEHR